MACIAAGAAGCSREPRPDVGTRSPGERGAPGLGPGGPRASALRGPGSPLCKASTAAFVRRVVSRKDVEAARTPSSSFQPPVSHRGDSRTPPGVGR